MDTRNAETPTTFNKEMIAKVWDTPAPQKARVTAWRILRNRLPICDNLRKRNIPMVDEEIMCNMCFHQIETTNHLFLLCPKTGVVWDEIQRWLGVSAARPHCAVSHLDFFAHLGRGKKSQKFLTALWICIIWLLWKRRNESRFEGKAWDIKNTIYDWGCESKNVELEQNFQAA
ncbi:uncharacterized protein LOC131009585 [Salvia miltiorrhiza]|uniref:uncharacterized protein LOC131009585 n=1 Tax=Salvia miltiorrhiza TaxID=226208 RepID=UPI0025ABA024|nr:uncharacterized protein LOC131009585 [Salvia miltiorrhiza]